MGKLATFLLANLELILAGMSIPVIVCIHLFVSWRFDQPWEVTSAAALTVGILHGGIAWMVRVQQRNVRTAMLQRLWAILQNSLSEQQHGTPGAIASTEPSEKAIRLAMAQLVGLQREPLVVRTIPYPVTHDMKAMQGVQ